MTLERKVAGVFRLTDENWMKHANPWSVWTRYSVLPFIVLAFWSRAWIGWWCLIPGSVSILWMFLNPVFFSKPQSTRNSVWGAVLGVAPAYVGKSWYLDRMVWLYESMKTENEEYRKWEY